MDVLNLIAMINQCIRFQNIVFMGFPIIFKILENLTTTSFTFEPLSTN